MVKDFVCKYCGITYHSIYFKKSYTCNECKDKQRKRNRSKFSAHKRWADEIEKYLGIDYHRRVRK